MNSFYRCELPNKAAGDAGAGDDVSVIDAEPPQTPTSNADADVEAGRPEETTSDYSYNIEFTFDSDVSCNITIMYFAKEDMVNGAVV